MCWYLGLKGQGYGFFLSTQGAHTSLVSSSLWVWVILRMQAVQVLSYCHFREKKNRQLFNETTSKPLSLPPCRQPPSYLVGHSVCFHIKVSGSSTTAWSKLMFFAVIRAELAIAMYSLYFRFNWSSAISSSLLTENLSFSSFRSLPSSKGGSQTMFCKIAEERCWQCHCRYLKTVKPRTSRNTSQPTSQTASWIYVE